MGCPTAEELRAAIAAQLGSDPFAADTSSAEQQVEIALSRVAQRPTGGADAQITWLDRDGSRQGERRLSSASEDCAELASGVVFAVAVQLQLQAAATRARAGAPPPAPPPPPPPAPRVERQEAQRPSVLVGVGGYGERGWSPEDTFGFRIFGALAGKRWSVDLGVQTTLPTERQLASGAGIEARNLNARLAPCWRLPPFGVCAVGVLGGLYVRGYGVDRVGSPKALIAGVGGRLQLAWPSFERFGVLINGEVVASLTPRDVLLNRSVVWSSSPTIIGVGIDLAAVFR